MYSENSDEVNFEFDPEWCAQTLILEQNNTIIRKHSKFFLFF